MKTKKSSKSRLLRRALAMVLTMVLLFTSIELTPFKSKADDTPPGESWNLSVTIGGKDIKDVTTIKKGDALKVSIDWVLDDSTNACPYEKTIDLNSLYNVALPDVVDKELYSADGEKVGVINLKDGVVVMTIDNPEFMQNKKGRTVKGNLEGSIDNGSNTYKSGDSVPFKIGTIDTNFIWDNGDSETSLDIYKSLGEFKNEGGEYYQYYKVKVSTGWFNEEDAEITLDKLTDTLGSSLSDIQDVKVSGVYGSVTGTSDGNSIDIAGNNLGIVLKRNSGFYVEYKAKVDSTVAEKYISNGVTPSTTNNKIEADYTTNKNNPGKKSSDATGLTAKAFNVDKTCGASSTDEKQYWTITVDVGDMWEPAHTDIAYYVKSIEDTLGAGLSGSSVSLSDFSSGIDGKFTYTYETTLTDEYKNRESTNVYNSVKVVNKNDDPKSKTATYTTKGAPSGTITKAYKSYDSANNEITWDVTVSGVKKESKNVILYDRTADYHANGQGEHKLISELSVNGVAVMVDGVLTSYGQQVISTKGTYGEAIDYKASGVGSLYFTDSFIEQNNGADFVVTYKTKMTSNPAESRSFFNDVELYYKAPGEDYPSKKGNAYAEYSHYANDTDAIKKTGKAKDSHTISYTIEIDLSKMINNNAVFDGSDLEIKDTLPKGLKIVSGSVGLKTNYTENEAFYYYASSTTSTDPADYEFGPNWNTFSETKKSLFAASNFTAPTPLAGTEDVSGNTPYTFNIPLTADKYNPIAAFWKVDPLAANAGLRSWMHDNIKLVLTYDAKMTDTEKQEVGVSGKPKEYENKAEASYRSEDYGKSSSKTTLTPDKAVMKKGEYIDPIDINGIRTRAIKYTVTVNPDALDLTGGKLTGIDKLGSALSFDLKNIVVNSIAADGTRTKLSQGTGDDKYSFEFDSNANTLTFSLPDSKHLELTYYVFINVYTGYAADDVMGTLTKENSSNSFTLYGDKVNETDSMDSHDVVVTRHDWEANANTGSVRIYKYWTDGGEMKAVKGTKFEVYAMSYDSTKGIYVKDSATPFGTYTVSDTGDLKIDDLVFNKVYMLKETSGGKDATDDATTMKTRTDEYLFVIPGSAMASFPPEVHMFSTGSTINYKNEKDDSTTVAIKINKKDDAGHAVSGAQLSVVKVGDNTIVDTWVSDGTTHEIKGLLKETEYVLKELSVPTGYKKADDIYFKYDSTSSKWQGKVSGGVYSNLTDPTDTITMTDDAVTSVKVTKTWSDGEVAHTGDTVTVELLADGTSMSPAKVQELSKTNNWAYTFTDLPKYNDDLSHTTIVYTVKETKIGSNDLADDIAQAANGSKYHVTYSGNALSGLKVINTKLGVLAIEKKFDGILDDSDLTDAQKEAIVFKVTRKDGTSEIPVAEVTYKEFTDGKVYFLRDLIAGEYIVRETNANIPGYKVVTTYSVETTGTADSDKVTTTVNDNTTNYVTVTNTYSAGKLELHKNISGITLNDSQKKGIRFAVYDSNGVLKYNIPLSDFSGGPDYTYTINDVPFGTYRVEELGAGVTGYNLTTTYSVDGISYTAGAKTTTVSDAVDGKAYVKNVYAQKVGSLKLTKIVVGDLSNLSDTNKAYVTFQLYDDKDNTVGSPVNLKDMIGGTHTFDNLPLGKYYIKETVSVGDTITESDIEYTWTTTYTVDSGIATASCDLANVKDGVVPEIKVTNTYTKKDTTGTLKLTKTFAGYDETITSTIANNIKFTIKKDGSDYRTVSLSDFTLSGTIYEYDLGNVPAGTYAVEETGAEISGYTLVTTFTSDKNGTETVDKNDVEIVATENSKIKVTNTYTKEKGKLTLTKVITKDGSPFTGLTDAQKEAIKFTVKDSNGATIITDKNLKDNFTDNGSGNYTFSGTELDNLPIGTYYVTETITGEATNFPGLVRETKYQVNSDAETATPASPIVTSGGTTSVTITNNYTTPAPEPSKIKITKRLNTNSADLEYLKNRAGDAVTFKVTQTKDASGADITPVENTYKLSDFTYNSVTGLYELDIEIPHDYYTVVAETSAEVPDFTFDSVAYVIGTDGGSRTDVPSGTDPFKALEKKGAYTVAFTNNYTRIRNDYGVLVLTKTFGVGSSFNAANMSDAQKDSIVFSVLKDDNTVYKTVSYSSFADDGTYTLTNVPVGTYKVIENGGFSGYSVLTTYKVGGSSPTTVCEPVVVVKDTYSNVYVDNTYTPIPETPDVPTTPKPSYGQFSISKRAIGGTAELPGARFELYPGYASSGTPITAWVSTDHANVILVGDKQGLSGDKMMVTPGIYTVVETIAPAGYKYAKAVSFTVDYTGKISITDNLFGEVVGTNCLAIKDEAFSISVNKVDEEGANLEGANLAIYSKDTALDANALPVESWISDGSTHKVAAKLMAGNDYIIREISAPEHYEKLDADIEIHIDEQGVVTLASAVSTDTATVNGNEITVVNKKTDLTHSTTTVVKTGDNTNVSKWIELLGIGVLLMGIFGYLFVMSKKKKDE